MQEQNQTLSYDDFKATFIKENKKLHFIIALSFITFSVGMAFQIISKPYFIHKGGDVFEEKLLLTEACKIAFESLVKGEPSEYFVSKGIIDLVKNEPFNLDYEKMIRLRQVDESKCLLILKGNKNLYAFQAIMNGSDQNPFYYKLVELNEVGVKEEDL